jgi:glucokinase
MKEDQKSILSIDIGGTKMLGALITPDGAILRKVNVLTQAAEGPDAVIGRLTLLIDGFLGNSSGAAALSLAVAGPIDLKKGIITESPNLPGWQDVPLRSIIRDKYDLPVFLLNDAQSAALGENCFGAGIEVENLIFLTVSTGIGGGIIINNRLYTGASGSAGEIGHMVIDPGGPLCNCGNRGHYEAMASGTALAREAVKRLKEGAQSVLQESTGGSYGEITAKTVAEAAFSGDAFALDVISQTARYLGIGLANLVNIFNPELIIIGGGLSNLGTMLLEPAVEEIQARSFHLPASVVRVVTARLGADAGILGAAVFAHDCLMSGVK